MLFGQTMYLDCFLWYCIVFPLRFFYGGYRIVLSHFSYVLVTREYVFLIYKKESSKFVTLFRFRHWYLWLASIFNVLFFCVSNVWLFYRFVHSNWNIISVLTYRLAWLGRKGLKTEWLVGSPASDGSHCCCAGEASFFLHFFLSSRLSAQPSIPAHY
jgi:hypothetical protein